LLSLESRDDVTNFALEYTSFEPALRRLAKWKDFPDNDALKIASRAAALNRHWKDSSHTSKSGQDVVYAPLLSAVPNKPQGWKLELTDAAGQEAERYYHALKTRRNTAYRYYQAKPPKPMGWAPQDGNAWAETPGDKIKSGDLFHSPAWSPIWMSFDLASIDLLMGMEEVGIPEEERRECFGALATKNEMRELVKGRDLRSEDILRS